MRFFKKRTVIASPAVGGMKQSRAKRHPERSEGSKIVQQIAASSSARLGTGLWFDKLTTIPSRVEGLAMTVLLGALSLVIGAVNPPMLFAAQVFESSQNVPAILELYSAQECKECPNAETWVVGLETRKDLWKSVIPMIFHVHYGADLGHDPLATRDHDLRLNHYLELWKASALMLPLLVLDGKPLAYSADLSKELNASRTSESKLTVKALDEQEFLILFEPALNESKKDLEIHAVLLGLTPSNSRDGKGNEGFTVISYRQKTVQPENGTYSSSIILPSKNGEGAQASAAAFWVMKGEGGQPLQAVGGWIKKG